MLTAERLRQLLAYEAKTGEFCWKVSRGNRVTGTKTGAVGANGYIYIGVDRSVHLAHRLAWLYVHGEWPATPIDHINAVKTDNRIANLRVATKSQNGANAKRNRRNLSGFKGVSFDSRAKRWSARICTNGRRRHLGTFDDPADAHAAYCRAAEQAWDEFARAG